MRNFPTKICLSAILLLMESIPVFAVDCKSIRSAYLKERHRCIGLFREAYAPEKQPPSGDIQMTDVDVNMCFANLKSDYPEFSEGGQCEGVEEENVDKKFEGYAKKCLHQKDFSECNKALENVKSVDNIRNGFGATLLMVAAQEGDMDAMNFLLQKGASAKKVDHDAWNLLHYALYPKFEKFNKQTDSNEVVLNIVRKILDLGVHPQELNLNFTNSLLLSIMGPEIQPVALIELLIKKGANVNYCSLGRAVGVETIDYSALYQSVARNRVDVVKLLVKNHVDVNKKTRYSSDAEPATPLFEAVYTGNLEIVKILLRAGANPNIDSKAQIPLGVAILNGDKKVVVELVNAGANVNDEFDWTGKFIGSKNTIVEITDKVKRFTILEFAENIAELFTATCVSCENEKCSKECADGMKNRMEIVKILKKAGATKPFYGSFGDYCLQPDLTEKMVYDAIKQGADVNESNSEGWTPLHAVAQEGENPKAMMALIKKGAFVNAMTKEGFTPLLSAAKHNPNPAFVKMLVNAGADINAIDPDSKWNALDMAVAYNSPEVVSFLLKTKLGNNLDDAYKNLLVRIAVTNNPNLNVLLTLFKNGFNAKPVGSGYRMKNPLYAALEEKKDAGIVKVLLKNGGVVDDKCMRLARDLPMDTPEERKYRNQIIDLLTKHKK